MNDLVKRLRAKVIDTGITQGLGGFPIRVTDGLCQEAADHIESQASVIATLENRLTLLAVDRDRIERLKGLCGRAAITIRFANVQQHLCGAWARGRSNQLPKELQSSVLARATG